VEALKPWHAITTGIFFAASVGVESANETRYFSGDLMDGSKIISPSSIASVIAGSLPQPVTKKHPDINMIAPIFL
jgi:hypothetical protein